MEKRESMCKTAKQTILFALKENGQMIVIDEKRIETTKKS